MGIAVSIDGGQAVSEREKAAYIDYVQKKYNRKLESMNIVVDGDFVNLYYKFEPMGFERIRRITGYLVGTMDNWNSAKAAEEADRVKHGIPEAGFERI